MKTISSDVKRMLESAHLRDFAGEAWLLEQEAKSRKSSSQIRSLTAIVIWRVKRQEKSCGFESLDLLLNDAQDLHELMAAPVSGEIEGWRCKEFGSDFEGLLDLVREEGTVGLASLLGCTQRRVQQKLKELFESESATFQGDLFFGGAA